jgi:hypothetical protein
LRDGISKKYRDIKNEFLRACKQRAMEYLEPEASQIRKNL